ncbi:serine threonine kinase fnkB [Fusarium pseudoanthophilum]|uniref:Serine threonine kinase fnkB n=1 Tax=Fusarium pseudoanthophilum TaxID=48495 RepID=A0A8H5LG53_9HYPO|nr:serine threonine kinase fnkB [Fusarium pseudoanthophilum]
MDQPIHIKLRIDHWFESKIPSPGDTLFVEVLHTFPGTTSPVKVVEFNNQGITERAVLKLYDRTHPGRLRKFEAPSLLLEREYRSWVRQGSLRDFIPTLEQAWKTYDPQDAIDYVSYNRENVDIPYFIKERFEAGVWYEFNRRRKTESMAYAQLRSIQGTKIPHLYANVRIPLSFIDKDYKATPEEEEFLYVPGILLQYYECQKLSELYLPGMAHAEWARLAQRTVNAIHDINRFGIVFSNYNNNAIFRRENDEPYIIDFAEALFTKDLIEAWIKGLRQRRGSEVTDYPPWRMDVGYWEMVKVYRNPQSFADAFFTQLSGCTLPDYPRIIEEITLGALGGAS